MEITTDLLKLYVQPYQDKIQGLEEENAKLRATTVRPYRSEQCHELFAALSKAQGEYLAATPNRVTHYWGTHYEDLDIILQACRAALTKHALSLNFEELLQPDGSTVLVALLGHASGQWMENRSRITPTKDDPMSYASLIGLKKRTGALNLLGFALKEDPMDDNAEREMADSRKIFAKGTALNKDYDPKKEGYERIAKEQLEELEYEIGDHLDLVEELYKTYKVESLADIPKSRYREARNNVVRIKNTRLGK